LVLIALLIVGLALSLWNRGNRLENYEGEIAK
jgi:hypothetical protein